MKATLAEFWARSRVYPMPKVGDVYGGNLRVVAVPKRGMHGVRVEVLCNDCGKRAVTYDFNARKGHSGCKGWIAPPTPLLYLVKQGAGDTRPLYVRALEARGSYVP